MSISNLKHELLDLLGDDVQFDESLKPLTSLRVGGTATAVAYPHTVQQVSKVAELCKKYGARFRAIGGGTNLLVADSGFDGVIIVTTKNMNTFSFDQTTHTLRADAGVRMSKLISAALQQQLAGLEFGAGIPGTLGGVLWMNGGTKGGSVDQIFVTMEVIDAEGQIKTLGKNDVPFRYRSCGLPTGTVILTGTLQLTPGESSAIQAKIDQIKSYRQGQPIQWPNAGSIFKNPTGDYAGRLIEASNLKGKTVGGAKISDSHANFIINTGSAQASDIIELINLVKQRVKSDHNVELETELEVLS